jgi:DNA polymerase III sliding clamp (beta) subunit (PCNA family)
VRRDGFDVAAIDTEPLLLAVSGSGSDVASLEASADGTVTVEGGAFAAEIPTVGVEVDFNPSDFESTHRIRIDISAFREALKVCKYALSDDEYAPYPFVNDVFLKVGADVIDAFSTDRRRVTHVPIYRADIPEGLQGLDVPIPRRLVWAILQYLEVKRGKRGRGKCDVRPNVTSGPDRVELLLNTDAKTALLRYETACGSMYATFSLKTDGFPDLKKFIPKTYKHILEIRCKPFIDALQSVIKGARWRQSEKYPRGMDMTIDGQGLRLSIDQVKVSCASSTRVVRGASDARIRINPKYLLEAIRALEETGSVTLLMHVGAPHEPVLLTYEGTGSLMEHSFVLVMPMRLD